MVGYRESGGYGQTNLDKSTFLNVAFPALISGNVHKYVFVSETMFKSSFRLDTTFKSSFISETTFNSTFV